MKGKVELGRDGEHLEILVDGIAYSSFHEERPWSGYVWDALAAAILLVPRMDPKVLVLGCGGGTALALMRRLRPDADLTAVELDPRVLRLARRRFRLDELGAEIVLGDGLEYLATTRQRYDLILDDMFGAGDDGLVRPVDDESAHLARIASRLRPGGVAATNSTSDDDPPGLENAVRDAYNDTFGHRLALFPRLGFNVVVTGSHTRLNASAVRRAKGVSDLGDSEAVATVRVKKA